MAQPATDLEILNYALTLEHFESALYQALIATNLLIGPEAQYLQIFADHEAAHIVSLTQVVMTLGGQPAVPLAAYNLPRISSRADLLSTIVSVEDLGAAAYLGQVPYLQNKDLLEAAIRIHNVEAEHAATWRVIAGSAVAPDTVAKGAAYDDVLKIVGPFLQAPTALPTATMPVPTATIVPPTTVPATVAPTAVTVSPVALPTSTPPSANPLPTGASGLPQSPFIPRRLGNG